MLVPNTQSSWNPPRPSLVAEHALRLMVVDDDVEDQQAIRSELVGAGFGNYVQYVSSGKGAVRALRRSETLPDVILMETWLHDVRGRNLLRWIKQKHPQIDVIALSHYASPAFVQKLYDDGLSCFIRKPFTMTGFVLALKTGLPGKFGMTLTRSLVVD